MDEANCTNITNKLYSKVVSAKLYNEAMLCLTSKYLADLHELENHPDSIAYIRDHIPDSTKKLYKAGHRQR